MKFIIGLIFCLWVLELCGALEFKETVLPCSKLPLGVKPIKYETHFKFPSLGKDKYEGQVNISVEFVDKLATNDPEHKKMLDAVEGFDSAQKTDPNLIVLHADKSLDITDVKVIIDNRFRLLSSRKELQIDGLLRDEAKQMIGIKLKKGIYRKTKGLISIAFKGKVRKDKRGIYLSTYNNGKRLSSHIVAQFQPTDARTAMPCFDEPRFRAPFKLALTHDGELYAFGNADLERSSGHLPGTSLVKTSFALTPAMPMHMVAFTVGEFGIPISTDVGRFENGRHIKRKIRVITAPYEAEKGRFALDVAHYAFDYVDRLVDFGYPMKKLDIIAIADHDKDNTESWGLSFVRDTLLLVDKETKPDSTITTAVNVAHVVVHQWFGNLISVGRWSDLWLTESVAAQLAFEVARNFFKESKYFFRLAILSKTLDADQSGTIHPLSPPNQQLETSEQIYGLFDTVEFMKSASLGQTIEDIIGYTRYTDGLKLLIHKHAFKTVSSEDYLNSMIAKLDEQQASQVTAFVESFTAYRGVPLIDVAVDQTGIGKRVSLSVDSIANARGSTAAVSKRRKQDLSIFTSVKVTNGDAEQTTSNVPIVANEQWEDANMFKLPKGFECEEGSEYFVKLSPEPQISTYFRTRYSDELYARLQVAIERHQLEPMDRLQILDDANSLVRAQLIESDTFRQLLQSYDEDDDPAVLIGLLVASKTLAGLEGVEQRPVHLEQAFVKLFERFGFKENSASESLILQRALQVIYKALIVQGNEQVKAAALGAFDEAKGNMTALHLREPVYTAVVLSGTNRVNQLLDKLSKTESYEEKIRLASALSLAKDKEVLSKLRDWLISSGLKKDTIEPFLSTISSSLEQ